MLDRRAFIGTALALPFIGVGEAVAATTGLERYIVLRGGDTAVPRTRGPASTCAPGRTTIPPQASGCSPASRSRPEAPCASA